ncbi:hypothetical protein [Moraxella canis]|uniref:hypothetical protein n=1 Tax=Moraxella canis TaxID=90239 RepID=UPI001D0D02D5|nr:hypothetical protein [Moraxella canis]
MNDAGDIAELNNPADAQGFVYPVVNGEYKIISYDSFIEEFRRIPLEKSRSIHDTRPD